MGSFCPRSQAFTCNANFMIVTADWLVDNGISCLGAVAVLLIGWTLAQIAARAIKRFLPLAYGVDKNFAQLLSQAARYAIFTFRSCWLELFGRGEQFNPDCAGRGRPGGGLAHAGHIGQYRRRHHADLAAPDRHWRVHHRRRGCRSGRGNRPVRHKAAVDQRPL